MKEESWLGTNSLGISSEPIRVADELKQQLEDSGYAFVEGSNFNINEGLLEHLNEIIHLWSDLPVDEFLPDGGRYRLRRHARFGLVPNVGRIFELDSGDYFQDKTINRFIGGVQRKFSKAPRVVFENEFLLSWILFNFSVFPLTEEERDKEWVIDVHLVRILAGDQHSGKPTPEGIHTDGFRFISNHLIEREGLIGGESQVYTMDEELIGGKTFVRRLDSLYADDTRVKHATTPIKCDGSDDGHRDMLLMSYHDRE